MNNDHYPSPAVPSPPSDERGRARGQPGIQRTRTVEARAVARQFRKKPTDAERLKVLRFWNHQLRGELEAVRFEIWHALMERTRRTEEVAGFRSKPAPSPRPAPPMGARETPRRTCE